MKESPNLLLHALLIAVLLTGATGARAEDGGQDPLNEPYTVQVGATKLTISPDAATTAAPEPNMDVVAEHIGQFQRIWNEHDRTDAAAEEAERAALESKYGHQRGMEAEPQLQPNAGESLEDFKKRSLDFSASWQSSHGRPTYRVTYPDGEEGLAHFQVNGGLNVTKEDYLAGVERGQRQNRDRKASLDGFTAATRFGIRPDEQGYDTDEQIEQRKDDLKKIEEHDKAQVEKMKEQFKAYQPARTLVSHEKQADGSP